MQRIVKLGWWKGRLRGPNLAWKVRRLLEIGKPALSPGRPMEHARWSRGKDFLYRRKRVCEAQREERRHLVQDAGSSSMKTDLAGRKNSEARQRWIWVWGRASWAMCDITACSSFCPLYLNSTSLPTSLDCKLSCLGPWWSLLHTFHSQASNNAARSLCSCLEHCGWQHSTVPKNCSTSKLKLGNPLLDITGAIIKILPPNFSRAAMFHNCRKPSACQNDDGTPKTSTPWSQNVWVC